MRMTFALFFLCAACAKSPEAINASYVSDRAYGSYSCAALVDERGRVESALATASQQQRNARTNDVVGVILIGLPVSTLSGDNVAYQVADLKGHLAAIDRNIARRQCQPSAIARQPSFSPAARVAQAPQSSNQPARIAKTNAPTDLPRGAVIASRIKYSASEIATYCKQGWRYRQLTSGEFELNPCYY